MHVDLTRHSTTGPGADERGRTIGAQLYCDAALTASDSQRPTARYDPPNSIPFLTFLSKGFHEPYHEKRHVGDPDSQ